MLTQEEVDSVGRRIKSLIDKHGTNSEKLAKLKIAWDLFVKIPGEAFKVVKDELKKVEDNE